MHESQIRGGKQTERNVISPLRHLADKISIRDRNGDIKIVFTDTKQASFRLPGVAAAAAPSR